MDKRLKMRKSSLEVAKLAMLSYFAENSLQIYKRKELYSIFSLMKVEWNLPQIRYRQNKKLKKYGKNFIYIKKLKFKPKIMSYTKTNIILLQIAPD